MSFFDLELFRVVSRNLRNQKLRSFLTLLGMVIGIAAIVALISLGEGLNISIQNQFQSLGTDTIIILPGGGFTESVLAKLKEKDVETVEKVKGVDSAFDIFLTTKQIQFGEQTKNLLVIGVDPKKAKGFEDTGFIIVAEGRIISPNDSFGVMIGNKLATKTFDKQIFLKQSIEMLDSNILIGKLRVIGINEKSSNSFASFFNEAVIMNAGTLKKMSTTNLSPSRIIAKAVAGEDIGEVKARIEKELEKAHGEKDFQVMTTRQIGETAGNVLGIVSLVLIGIAAISLFVGGIGIMNTMLMAVMERTKEIGIMKAIGATNPKILSIFLLEAGFIGVIGGIIGLAFGIGISAIISIASAALGFELPLAISPFLIVFALSFSLAVGIIAGIAPALRAARLDPVEALRYE